MADLVENLKVRNSTCEKNGAEKKETKTILVEFGEMVLPKELYFGFLRYNVREYVPKPM